MCKNLTPRTSDRSCRGRGSCVKTKSRTASPWEANRCCSSLLCSSAQPVTSCLCPFVMVKTKLIHTSNSRLTMNRRQCLSQTQGMIREELMDMWTEGTLEPSTLSLPLLDTWPRTITPLSHFTHLRDVDNWKTWLDCYSSLGSYFTGFPEKTKKSLTQQLVVSVCVRYASRRRTARDTQRWAVYIALPSWDPCLKEDLDVRCWDKECTTQLPVALWER